jgi:hypothetical protein
MEEKGFKSRHFTLDAGYCWEEILKRFATDKIGFLVRAPNRDDIKKIDFRKVFIDVDRQIKSHSKIERIPVSKAFNSFSKITADFINNKYVVLDSNKTCNDIMKSVGMTLPGFVNTVDGKVSDLKYKCSYRKTTVYPHKTKVVSKPEESETESQPSASQKETED